ncbi:MAG: hypothetical protein VKP62_04490, partial [Candidatus Sericytochromatia bacterium]|nr:hypothetical protein [Candidatus Sericytochromatia bacterium]
MRAPETLARLLQAALLTALISPLWLLWGPAPQPSPELWADGQIEVADRAWLVAWGVLPPLFYLWTGLPSRWRLPLFGGWFYLAALVGSLALLAHQDLGQAMGHWAGLPWPDLVAAAVLLAPVEWLARRQGARPWLTLGSAALLLHALCFSQEHAGGVIDSFHLRHTLDELLSYVAGRIPLVDYAPQYTALLGAPLLLLGDVVRQAPLDVTLSYVGVLSGVTLVAYLAGQLWAFGGRSAWLHLLVLASVPMVSNGRGGIPLSYHALFPIRLLLPALTFAAIAAWAQRTSQAEPRVRQL